MLYYNWLLKKLLDNILGIPKSANWWKIGSGFNAHWVSVSLDFRRLLNGRITSIIHVRSNNDKENGTKESNSRLIRNAFIFRLTKSVCSKVHETCDKEDS